MSLTYICILEDTDVNLWGLSGRERILRMFRKHDVPEFSGELANVPPGASVLLLRADYLYDPRLLPGLINMQEDAALYASDGKQIVAVKAGAGNTSQAAIDLASDSQEKLRTDLSAIGPHDLVGAYDPRLLKYDPPLVLRICRENQERLEIELYDGSYKGVTDFVTKWLWPLPARMAVRFCVKHGISANQVTLLSLVLAVLAGLAFWGGFLLTGLCFGWFMTFLDTVDGKLARVTITSSKVGDILDHGLDLVHPPLWYLAWALGIADTWMSSTLVMPLFWLVLGAYVGGRLCEGAFELWVAPFRLFLWKPWDSYNRLVTARRNPNLVLLSLSMLFSRPDVGLYLVVIWHVISTLLLFMRIVFAVREKRGQGELSTWLNTIDPERDRHRLEVRLFTRLGKSSDGSQGI